MKKDRYRELFERSADAILIIVGDKFVDCNDATVKMLRYKSKQDLLNTHPSQLSPEHQPDGRLSYEKANEMIEIAFEKGSHRFEWDHKRADGEVFPVEVLLTAIKEGEENTLHVVWREITDRKINEQTLLRLTSIIESTSDMVSTATPDGKIQFMNNSGLEMLGWTLENLSEKNIRDAHPRWVLEIISQGITEAIDKGIWTGETAILDQNTRELPVSQVIMSHFSKEGKLEYLSTIIRNISDLKEAEKKLEDNLYLLNSIIDNQPTCVKLVRFDGTLLDMNPAGLKMINAPSKETAIGKNVYDLIHQDDRESFRQFNEKICSGQKGSLNYRMIASDGSLHHMESIAVPLHYGPKDETIQLGITIDVTQDVESLSEKNKLEDQLRQSQKMESLGTLAGGIAHDFNNILAVILGYTELSMANANNPGKLHEDLLEVLKGINRAKELVQQILTFSRKTDHELRPLRIQLIIKEALKLLRSTIPTTIEIIQDIDSNCPTVLADPTQIHQIVMNLCTNAYQAMKEKGGVLGVSLQQVVLDEQQSGSLLPGEYIELKVTDTGGGISQEIQEKIFEPYFTTKEKEEGTGLGLAVVHGIVASLNGKVAVDSKQGKCTEFTIFLPIIEASEATIQEEEVFPLPKGNEHILLVDDDEIINQMNESRLTSLGYKVTVCTSGPEAIQIFHENPNQFDLIITDMTMPKMTGAEFAQEILAVKPNVPIILCTGYSELINEEKAKEIGIRDFLVKPVSLKKYVTIIRKILDESRA